MYMFYSKKKKPKIYDSQAKCQTFINGVKENSYKSYHVMDEIKITYNLFTKHTKKKNNKCSSMELEIHDNAPNYQSTNKTFMSVLAHVLS